MSMQDPIADMLTRIRNAQMANLPVVNFPHSNTKEHILKVLQQEGYISNYTVVGDGHKNIHVELRFYQGKPVISHIKRLSKPSLRLYVKAKEMPEVNGGLGVAVVSTSNGIMSAKQAKQMNLGGELICEVI